MTTILLEPVTTLQLPTAAATDAPVRRNGKKHRGHKYYRRQKRRRLQRELLAGGVNERATEGVARSPYVRLAIVRCSRH